MILFVQFPLVLETATDDIFRSFAMNIPFISVNVGSVRTYLRAILQREQIQSLEADSASQALGIIQKLYGRLDLIVCDREKWTALIWHIPFEIPSPPFG